jgi:hypothetical protein
VRAAFQQVACQLFDAAIQADHGNKDCQFSFVVKKDAALAGF